MTGPLESVVGWEGHLGITLMLGSSRMRSSSGVFGDGLVYLMGASSVGTTSFTSSRASTKPSSAPPICLL